MTTASEIQQLALDVFENKMNYKDNDFIVIMNILKESYMKVKGFLNENENGTKGVDSDSDLDTEGEEEEEEQYTNYDSDAESDDADGTYSGSYLSPY
tara:strand:+ start:5029 stop:5319 length:291 start_codon:yes stop_codon:yes gene_type:complete